jgi:anaerobic selenocysteine-containing dehydrogenase
MDRRRFLKVTAVAGASTALASCGHPENQIIRFIPEDEITPGIAAWKPSICPLCPAACGLHVRVMDADVDVVRNGERGVMRATVAKKLEGLTAHPVNRGALCARGQAAIQVTYHPDRLRAPMKRTGPRGSGQYQAVSWDEALTELASRIDALAAAESPRPIAALTRPRAGVREHVLRLWLERLGAPPPLRVSLLDEDVLRLANARSFGRHQLPTIDLAQARFVIAFGADLLGTWNSPVAQAAGYGAMRQGTRGVRGTLVQVEARMSQTGANADRWIVVRPGTEGALALGLAHVILRDGRGRSADVRPTALIEGWADGLPRFAPAEVERLTGVPAGRIEELARAFAESPRPVAVIGGAALAHTNGLAQAMAVNALNALVGSIEVSGGIQFTPSVPGWESAVIGTGAAGLAQWAADRLTSSAPGIDVLLIDDVNAVFLSPSAWRVREAIERVPFIASFGPFLDETSILADLLLPDHSFLESWVDATPESGATVAVAAVAPPAMRPLHDSRSTPDVLLDVARRLKQPLTPPLAWERYEDLLREQFSRLPATPDAPDAWEAAQSAGGWWGATMASAFERPQPAAAIAAAAPPVAVAWNDATFAGEPQEYPFHLLPYASTALYDGSVAHLPWLQEMPDPMTSAMWSNWIEVNPVAAARLQIATGDLVEIASPHGSVQAPVVVTPGVAADVVAMPLGQGHISFTRYASGRGSNPIAILAPLTDTASGALAWAATRVQVRRVGDGRGELILFAGSDVEHLHEHR